MKTFNDNQNFNDILSSLSKLDIKKLSKYLQLLHSIIGTKIDTGIIKTLDEVGNTVVDGYGRTIQLKKAVIDNDRIEELWLDNPEFMEHIEGEYDE